MKIIRNDSSFTITDFRWDHKYSYVPYERDDTHGPRTYAVGEKKVPSVTTILSATQSADKTKTLDAWRERVGYQEAQAITTQASNRGTEMHFVLENYINGRGYLNLSKEGAQARLMAHTIIQNLPELKIVYGSEVNLAYEGQWAGSTDLVALYKGEPTIIDFKQSNRFKKREYVEDYHYQIAAYALAHKKVYGPITRGLIAICTKDIEFQSFELDENILKEYEDRWFSRVEKYYKLP